MTVPQDRAMTEADALEWIIRQRDPAFEDWDAFTDWLEADPAHADVYHAMAAADADMAPLVEQWDGEPDEEELPPLSVEADEPEPVAAPTPGPVPIPANDDAPSPRRLWIAGALAASLVAIVGIGTLMPRSQPWTEETKPGERRTVELADGSRIVLNGATRITLDRATPRKAVLETGEALFIVQHDESDPFEVKAGTARLVDIGTAFNVVRDGRTLDVAVSEGAVLYNPDGEKARIDAGRRLHSVEGEDSFRITNVDSGDVAGWREGRLVYDGQPLSTVAADLTRYYGVKVTASRDVSARLFRGVLSLPKPGAVDTLAPVLGVAIRGDGTGWVFLPRS